MKMRSVQFECLDEGQRFWKMINAVWPEACWGKDFPADGEPPIDLFVQCLVGWKYGKSSEETTRSFVEAFWANRTWAPTRFYSEDGQEPVDEDWQVVDKVSVPEPGVIHFILNKARGYLEIRLLESCYSSIHYTVTWFAGEPDSEFYAWPNDWTAINLHARNLIMSYLMAEDPLKRHYAYITCNLEQSQVTMWPEKALCDYLLK